MLGCVWSGSEWVYCLCRLNEIILAILEPFLFNRSGKNYCYNEFFTVSVKMPKIYLFEVTEPKL